MGAWALPAADAWWGWFAPLSVRVALAAAVVALVDLALGRRFRPERRAALWWLVPLLFVLPPWLGARAAALEVDLPRAAAAEPVSGGAAPLWPAAVWAAGLGLGALCFAWRYLALRRRLLASARPAPRALRKRAARAATRLGMGRAPRTLVLAGGGGPAVLGFLRPVVLVPAALIARGEERRLDSALLHEVAHIARRDPLASLGLFALQLVYWFHPAAWLARARLAELRELGCDQTVARALGGRTGRYRAALLEHARVLLERPAAGRLAFVHRHARILARLEWLERPLPARPRLARAVSCALTLSLACCVPGLRPTAPALPLDLPPLDELEGCLQRRYAVLALMAQAGDARALASNTNPGSLIEEDPE